VGALLGSVSLLIMWLQSLSGTITVGN
jgi:hypothetical protein